MKSKIKLLMLTVGWHGEQSPNAHDAVAVWPMANNTIYESGGAITVTSAVESSDRP
jgi:hypothetical protein